MNIYVGNLSLNTHENALQEHFEACGRVSSVKIIKDFDSGYSKGFGFVEMFDENEGKDAVEKLHASSLDGNTLVVNEAKPRAEKSNYSSGGGSGYNRNSGGGGYRGGNNNNRGGGKRW